MNTQQSYALYLADELELGTFVPNVLQNEAALRQRAAAELRRQHARITELEAQLAQRFDAEDMATASAQGFRDGVASLTAQAADRAIENCPELNMGNYDEVDVERLNDWAIRANDEIDRLHALAAGQATAAQPAPATQQAGIPGNFITHRAAWREALETAKFVSTGVDRSYWDHELAAFDRSFDRLWTLMQYAPRPSPTAQSADSVQEDAARYRWLAANCRSTSEHWGGRWSIVIEGPAPKSHNSEDDFDAAVDAARKQGENHDQ